ncbi:MAG TPA: hypothetical protein PL059_13560 [Spirochaetota bacterium]|nr:hypothetical protein [Spirochaetota bacterium]HOM10726.1 hypothetical protein [Spirochaetota bacterium]
MTSKSNKTTKYFVGFQIALVVVFTTIDFIGLLLGYKINFVAIPKGLLSLSATLFVWFGLQDTIAQKDKRFLRLIFTCTFITDMCVLTWTHFLPDMYTLLTIGGIVALPMLLTVIIRHTEMFKAVQKKDIGILIVLYAVAFIIIIYLFEMLQRYNILGISIAYALLLVPVAWSGWLARRSEYFPAHSRWMIPAATTSYFIMDVIGIFYNVRYGSNPDLFYFFTWPLYAVFLILMPLSGKNKLLT